MAAIAKVCVVGGGLSGMAAALQLCRAGCEVELIEKDPAWCPCGAGISMSGPTLRALRTLGVYEAFGRHGWLSAGVDLCAPDGRVVAELPTPPPAGADVAGGGAIMRPVLARILAEATRAAGVRVTLGHTWAEIAQDDRHVWLRFDDGRRAAYDLVVAADGVHSQMRAQLMPEVAAPAYVGQCVWRAVLPRPADITRPRMWLGDGVKVGVNPVSAEQMYMFITENQPRKEHPDPSTWPDHVARLLRAFPAPQLQQWAALMYQPQAAIDHRPLVNLLVPLPWHRGRVVLIGDAVHATTPHLASGAGIGIESAIVLAEELTRHENLQESLAAFERRRWERCRLVVQNSERLARLEIEGGDKTEHARLMRESMAALARPI